MKIAVTSQNRTTITGHAGKCRKFWIFEIKNQQVQNKQLLELPREQSYHESAHTVDLTTQNPLDEIHVLITAGIGQGLRNRLQRKNIQAIATSETDPDCAVAAWLNGSLLVITPEAHEGDHHHDKECGQG